MFRETTHMMYKPVSSTVPHVPSTFNHLIYLTMIIKIVAHYFGQKDLDL